MSVITRTPYLKVTVDGIEVTNRFSAHWSLGYDLRVGEATISLPFTPPWAKYYSYVVIEAGANQATSRVRWSGFIVEFDSTSFPGTVDLICRGPLYFADLDQCDAAAGIDLSNAGVGQSDQVIVAFLLFEAGLAAYHGTLGGTGKTLGTVAKDQYVWPLGQSALSMIDAIDQISLGWRTFETAGGSIIRVQITASPGDTAAYSFVEGVDILSESTNQQSVMSISNAVNVTGYSPAGGTQFSFNEQQANPYIINGVRVTTLASPLLESSATGGAGISCQEVADWLLPEVNRGLDTLTLATPRDDLIGPGTTIAVNSPRRLGLHQNLWVQRVDGSVDMNGFTQRLTCVGAALGTGGTGAVTGGVGGGGSVNPPPGTDPGDGGSGGGGKPPVPGSPTVDFTLTVEQERVIVSGSEVDLFIVSCVSAVTPGTGAIVSYAWTTSGGSPHPSSGSNPDFTTGYAAISTQTITLTVTDANGNTGAATHGMPAAGSAGYVRRRIFLAGTSVIDDFDGIVWRSHANSSTVVGNGPLWASGVALLTSTDDLATAPHSINPFSSGNVTAIWFESDASPQNILVGNSNGALARSGDGGTTFTICNASPDGTAILRCVWSRSVRGQFFALTAGGLFRSDNYGAGWVTVVAAAGGETFRDVNVSFARIMIAMSGGRLVCDEAGTAQTLPSNSGDVYAITADIRADRFYAYDSAGHTFYHTADGGTTMGARVDLPVTAAVRGLWRDSSIRGLLYFAAGAAYKSVDGFGSAGGYFQVRASGVGGASGNYVSIGTDGQLSQAPFGASFIVSTPGVEKTFAVIPPATPPAGWQQPGFNATSWQPSIVDAAAPGPGGTPTGATWISYNPETGLAHNTLILYLRAFTLASGTIHSASVQVSMDNRITGIWINGTVLCGTLTPDNTGQTLSIPPALLRAGAANVLAIIVDGYSGSPSDISRLVYRLDVI